jgi:hypothetical protein
VVEAQEKAVRSALPGARAGHVDAVQLRGVGRGIAIGE